MKKYLLSFVLGLLAFVSFSQTLINQINSNVRGQTYNPTKVANVLTSIVDTLVTYPKNTATNLEIAASNGTKLTHSGIFVNNVGAPDNSLNLGNSSASGSSRTITAAGSSSNIDLIFANKGPGRIFGFNTTSGSAILQTGGSATAFVLNGGVSGVSLGTTSSNKYLNVTSDASSATLSSSASTNIVITPASSTSNVTIASGVSGTVTIQGTSGNTKIGSGNAGTTDIESGTVNINATGTGNTQIGLSGTVTAGSPTCSQAILQGVFAAISDPTNVNLVEVGSNVVTLQSNNTSLIFDTSVAGVSNNVFTDGQSPFKGIMYASPGQYTTQPGSLADKSYTDGHLQAHVVNANLTTSFSLGTGAGTGATGGLNFGTDVSGSLNVTTAGTPATAATICTVTFLNAYGRQPAVVLTPANNITASLTAAQQVYVGPSTTNFIIKSNNTTGLTTGQTYSWFYHVLQ